MENVDFGFCKVCQTHLGLRNGSRCTGCDRRFHSVIQDHACGQCLKKKPSFESVHGLFQYYGPMGNALRRGKYSGIPDAIGYVGKHCALHLPTSIMQDPPRSIIPVPIHWKRVFQRGFDTPLILSDTIKTALKCNVSRHQLTRVRHTREQAGLNEDGRRRNVRGAFRFQGNAPNDVLLVDDVYTTGATVREASKVLRRAGCERIRVLCAVYVDPKSLADPITHGSTH